MSTITFLLDSNLDCAIVAGTLVKVATANVGGASNTKLYVLVVTP